MLDLSEEPIEENIHTSVEFFKRMKPLGMGIEIELGVTGGEEDGVDNSDVENSKLYTQPEDVAYAYKELSRLEKCLLLLPHLVMCMVFINQVMLNCVP
jgi:fructose-bisphosphate aldolase class II